MWGALAEYRSVTSDINASIFAMRLRIFFAFMTTPVHVHSADLRCHRAHQPSAVRCRPGGFHCRHIPGYLAAVQFVALVPLHLRACFAEQQRDLLVGRRLGRFERVFDPSTFLNPLVPLQIVDGHLPAFRGAENESTEMLLRGVVSPHEIPLHRILTAAPRIAVTNSISASSRSRHSGQIIRCSSIGPVSESGSRCIAYRSSRPSVTCCTITTVAYFS